MKLRPSSYMLTFSLTFYFAHQKVKKKARVIMILFAFRRTTVCLLPIKGRQNKNGKNITCVFLASYSNQNVGSQETGILQVNVGIPSA